MLQKLRLPAFFALLMLCVSSMALNAKDELRFELIDVDGVEYETLRVLKDGAVITVAEVEMGISVLAFPSHPDAYIVQMGPNGKLRNERAGDHHLGLYALMGDWEDEKRGIGLWKPTPGKHTLTAKVLNKDKEHLGTYEITVVVKESVH